ncbi:hypothetical protein G7Y89_g13087 [Cudoniella acicularis]|uniref:Transposase Tc1-like domain-containing protein n=1 Tax=Cudoniella acicularis TaxID=354080 RepID=A0A8H4R815_9HELO|nr:hypothetical protein G7Y89_g13087 [Cudoniella acicularis]
MAELPQIPLTEADHHAAMVFVAVTVPLLAVALASLAARITHKIQSQLSLGWEDYLIAVGVAFLQFPFGRFPSLASKPAWVFSFYVFIKAENGIYSSTWNTTITGARCVSTDSYRAVSNAQSSISIATDLILSFFPLTFLHKLRRPIAEKVLVGVLMAMGMMASGASITKAVLVIQWPHAVDSFSLGFAISTWTCVEMFLGITAACLPTLKSKFQRLLALLGIDFTFDGSHTLRSISGGGGTATRMEPVSENNENHNHLSSVYTEDSSNLSTTAGRDNGNGRKEWEGLPRTERRGVMHTIRLFQAVTYTEAQRLSIVRALAGASHCTNTLILIRVFWKATSSSQAQAEKLVEFVYASAQNRRMSFQKLVEVMDFGIKNDAIRIALLREGFHRRLVMRKPPITEKNRQLRKAWALEHVEWTIVQWHTKGPGIFWEKDWGLINKGSYQAHTVPIIHGYIELMRRQGVHLKLMQD